MGLKFNARYSTPPFSSFSLPKSSYHWQFGLSDSILYYLSQYFGRLYWSWPSYNWWDAKDKGLVLNVLLSPDSSSTIYMYLCLLSQIIGFSSYNFGGQHFRLPAISEQRLFRNIHIYSKVKWDQCISSRCWARWWLGMFSHSCSIFDTPRFGFTDVSDVCILYPTN